MPAARAHRLAELFRQAIVLPPGERSAFLADACDDAALRAEVEDLLRRDARAPPDFLAPPGASVSESAAIANADAPDPLIGVEIGRCRVVACIAAGGMGVVYEAVQQQPRRTVAVKMMNARLISPLAFRRFEHESQILAHLRHPNIAHVYDAGTYQIDRSGDRGIPYFVMELVPDAEPVTDYARRRGLSVRERLGLFSKVCSAVYHGHQKGVIHRDLKPGNILVGPDGEPKIIDFGVARTTDADVALTTMRTDVGQLVGTLQYMSPEQCAGDPNDIDMRSDVFCLGVVLYQLLCSQLPFDVTAVPIFEATRIIREHVPARPSTIDRALRGDMETMVLTALEKDREKRYQSVADLARDIHRYLNREPIEARPPTLSTRVIRWAARHPVRATSSICVFIAVTVLASTVLVVQLYNVRPHRIELVDGGKEARLVAFGGRTISAWVCDEYEGASIRMAQLIREPAALGGRRLAVLGFARAYGATPFSESLCVYDANKDLENPVWERHINETDMPIGLRANRGFVGTEFHIARGMIDDVFPEPVGSEIITIHQHESTTHSAIRVYDLRGNVLYQVWVDALIEGVYWMSSARLLVLAGSNGAAYWPQRGQPNVRRTHPSVVFAVRPELGFIAHDYVAEVPGDDLLSPVWYNCLLPPRMSEVFDISPPNRPGAKYDPGQAVQFGVHTRETFDGERGSLSWVLNESGNVAPGSLAMGDTYRIHQSGLPDPRELHFGPLPPIVEPNQRPADSGPTGD